MASALAQIPSLSPAISRRRQIPSAGNAAAGPVCRCPSATDAASSSPLSPRRTRGRPLPPLRAAPSDGANGGGGEEGPTSSSGFGYTRLDVIVIGLGIVGFGVAAFYALEAAGVETRLAGNFVQFFVVIAMTVGWIGSYLFRVANKDMTYAKQARASRGEGRGMAPSCHGGRPPSSAQGWRTVPAHGRRGSHLHGGRPPGLRHLVRFSPSRFSDLPTAFAVSLFFFPHSNSISPARPPS